MKISASSPIEEVAAAVGDALRRAGIQAVLTGGGCAVLYSGGEYHSEDLDFIIQTAVPLEELEETMRALGFERRGDQYFHSKSPFFVEFPRGPLGIGRDIQIRPVELQFGERRLLTLSPTDSCRDRLAAFFFWNDRQGLEAALSIATQNETDLDVIRRWAIGEGAQARFNDFRRELQKRKRSRTERVRSRPRSRSRRKA